MERLALLKVAKHMLACVVGGRHVLGWPYSALASQTRVVFRLQRVLRNVCY